MVRTVHNIFATSRAEILLSCWNFDLKVAAVSCSKEEEQRDTVEKYMKEFDLDNSGYIEASELLLLGQNRKKLGQKTRVWTEVACLRTTCTFIPPLSSPLVSSPPDLVLIDKVPLDCS